MVAVQVQVVGGLAKTPSRYNKGWSRKHIATSVFSGVSSLKTVPTIHELFYVRVA